MEPKQIKFENEINKLKEVINYANELISDLESEKEGGGPKGRAELEFEKIRLHIDDLLTFRR